MLERLKMCEFLLDFLKYSEQFENEKNDPDGSWAWEFVEWLHDKTGWKDDTEPLVIAHQIPRKLK